MKKIKYPDYMNSTVSLANSVLKYFGAPVHHETLALLDRELAEREKTRKRQTKSRRRPNGRLLLPQDVLPVLPHPRVGRIRAAGIQIEKRTIMYSAFRSQKK